APPVLEDGLEARHDRRRVLRRQHAGRAERFRPGDAPPHVVFKQHAVETERDAEVEGGGVGRRVEPAGPQRHDASAATSGAAGCASTVSTVHAPLASLRRTMPFMWASVLSASARCASCRTMAAGAAQIVRSSAWSPSASMPTPCPAAMVVT